MLSKCDVNLYLAEFEREKQIKRIKQKIKKPHKGGFSIKTWKAFIQAYK